MCERQKQRAGREKQLCECLWRVWIETWEGKAYVSVCVCLCVCVCVCVCGEVILIHSQGPWLWLLWAETWWSLRGSQTQGSPHSLYIWAVVLLKEGVTDGDGMTPTQTHTPSPLQCEVFNYITFSPHIIIMTEINRIHRDFTESAVRSGLQCYLLTKWLSTRDICNQVSVQAY